MKINTPIIKHILDKKGMTFRDLSIKVGVTERSIMYMMQSESTTLKKLSIIADGLEVDPKSLLI